MATSRKTFIPGPSDFSRLPGVWRSRGYGIVLHVTDSAYTLYEETAMSCVPVFAGTLAELSEHYADTRISPGRQTFSVRRAAGVTRVGFRRLQALPPNAGPPDDALRTDPGHNFDVLWHTFAENYALFDLRGIDWTASYRRHRCAVSADMPPAELFDLFIAMLQPLGDGHVELRTPHGHFNAGMTPPLFDRLAHELTQAHDAREVHAYVADLREAAREIIHETYLGGRVQSAAHHLFEWGRLDGHTGYLAIRAMAGQSGYVGQPRKDLDAVDAAMIQIIEDFADLSRVVIDLRGNGGGYDIVALRIAEYFTDRKRVALTKSARFGAGFSGKQPVYVAPREAGRYTGALVLLTSGLTASAAEVFVLALLKRPRVKRVGETTHGILSDAMERHLPNGWFVTLSNELYRAADDQVYEERGIPPHVESPFLDRYSRERGRDNILDYVLNMPN